MTAIEWTDVKFGRLLPGTTTIYLSILDWERKPEYLEKTQGQHANSTKKGTQLVSRFKHMSLQLWGDSANHHTTVLQPLINLQYIIKYYCVIYYSEAKTEKDLQSSPHPGGLYILLHTLCDSSPWGLSQNSGHYIVAHTPS